MNNPSVVLATPPDLRHQLHQLAQPMAVLHCRLELGLMSSGEANLRDAIQGGLADLQAAVDVLNRVREMVYRSEETILS